MNTGVFPVVELLKTRAKALGLWNLFLPAESGISQLDDAGLAEVTGRSLELAPGNRPVARARARGPRLPDPRHLQQSMVIVARDTPDVTLVRDVPVFGGNDQHGHREMEIKDVRLPVTNVLGEEGAGISESRLEIEQARLLCQHASAIIDAEATRAAAPNVSMAGITTPRIALNVIDRAIQVHGGMGVSDDVPLAAMYGWHRAKCIFDGPDEVHLRTITKSELAGDAELKSKPTPRADG